MMLAMALVARRIRAKLTNGMNSMLGGADHPPLSSSRHTVFHGVHASRGSAGRT
jgi:hypothetical protein